jgi:hypothetical protein
MSEIAEPPRIVVEGVELGREALVERAGELAPVLISERDGSRSVERFDEIGDARQAAAEFARDAGADDRSALVYRGHVGLDDDAIEVELREADRGEVVVFFQRFEVGGRFRRGPRLAGEITLAGQREALV